MSKSLQLTIPKAGMVYVDEVGRGPLVGDVVAAAVLFAEHLPDPDNPLWYEIKDSKKVSSKKKMGILADFIRTHSLAWSIGRATVEEIDRHNILQATYMAMHRALDGMGAPFDHITVDGNRFLKYKDIPHTCLVGGDALHLGIASASIVAKDARDRDILKLCEDHPELQRYDIHKNMGYGTKSHMEALRQNGPTAFHRKSFAPCQRALTEE